MKISIVTLSFNQRSFLPDCLHSIQAQSGVAVEHIVVDPGSTDGSREYLLEQEDAPSRRHIFEPDRGAAEGLNKGFAKATAEIWGFLNADDVLLPGALARVLRTFTLQPKADIVSAHGVVIDGAGRLVRRIFSDRMTPLMYRYRAGILVQQSTFFRPRIFHEVGGFNPDNPICWDGELFLAMLSHGARLQVLNEFWSGFRVHASSITGSERLREAKVKYPRVVFERFAHRPWRHRDFALSLLLRSVKHLRNPANAWEAVARLFPSRDMPAWPSIDWRTGSRCASAPRLGSTCEK